MTIDDIISLSEIKQLLAHINSLDSNMDNLQSTLQQELDCFLSITHHFSVKDMGKFVAISLTSDNQDILKKMKEISPSFISYTSHTNYNNHAFEKTIIFNKIKAETHLLHSDIIKIHTSEKQARPHIENFLNTHQDKLDKIIAHHYLIDDKDDLIDSIYNHCNYKLQQQKSEELYNQIKTDPRVMMAKNQDQRIMLAKTLFDNSDIKYLDDSVISRFLLDAKNYYEITFIPQQVQELSRLIQDGKKLSQKEISERLGISIAKVKKYQSIC